MWRGCGRNIKKRTTRCTCILLTWKRHLIKFQESDGMGREKQGFFGSGNLSSYEFAWSCKEKSEGEICVSRGVWSKDWSTSTIRAVATIIYNTCRCNYRKYMKGCGKWSVLDTANLHSIPQLQIPQNCKRCSAIANPQVCDRFAVTFRTSANSDRNIYCYFVLVITFFWRSNFVVAQTLTSKKKGNQHPHVNLQPRK